MHRYAQTILQLHAQLATLSWSAEDRRRVAVAYRLACELFSGQSRGSGKSFVDHLVGTASIVARHGGSPVATAAALLHAAYDLGDFGDGLEGPAAPRRSELRQTVGEDVEAHVHAYAQLPWKDATIARVLATLAAASAFDRAVLLMRVANELEDHLDLGIRYCRNASDRLKRLERRGEPTIAVAVALGHEALARELADAFTECRTHEVPGELLGPSEYTSLMVPRSCVKRLAPRIRRRIADWRHG
jgi:(p)ppGpp synthase/HD superfamily hydrolase